MEMEFTFLELFSAAGNGNSQN